MILRPYAGPPVYRLRAGEGTLDSYDDPTPNWSVPDRLRLTAEVQPVSSAEADGITRTLVEDERRLYVAGVANLRAADRIDFGDGVWEIDGDPFVRRGLTGTHTVAALKRITA